MVEMIESKSLGVQPNTAEKKRFPEKKFHYSFTKRCQGGNKRRYHYPIF